MLVLMRREQESLLIYPEDNIPEDMTVAELFANGPLEVKVTSTNDFQCKLGIKAPSELAIVRNEIYQVGNSLND
jgi:sRNA-binding carbon storage regulator CsrA